MDLPSVAKAKRELAQRRRRVAAKLRGERLGVIGRDFVNAFAGAPSEPRKASGSVVVVKSKKAT